MKIGLFENHKRANPATPEASAKVHLSPSVTAPSTTPERSGPKTCRLEKSIPRRPDVANARGRILVREQFGNRPMNCAVPAEDPLAAVVDLFVAQQWGSPRSCPRLPRHPEVRKKS